MRGRVEPLNVVKDGLETCWILMLALNELKRERRGNAMVVVAGVGAVGVHPMVCSSW